jgi:hypothetical protein
MSNYLLLFICVCFSYVKNVHPFLTTDRGLSMPKASSSGFLMGLGSSVIYEEEHLNHMIEQAHNSGERNSDLESLKSVSISNQLTEELLSAADYTPPPPFRDTVQSI